MRMIGISALCASLSCGASFAQLQERELCGDRAEARAQAALDSACAEFDTIEHCPAADGVLDRFQCELEVCTGARKVCP